LSQLDLHEFLEAYLAEVDDLLTSANAQLLALEQGVEPATPRQVRDLFRALHTVKGLSAMVGVDPIVSLAHRMEGALRSADRAGGSLARGAVDLLLQGVQAIEQRVAALAQGRAVPDAPVALLEAIEALDALERSPAQQPDGEPSLELSLEPTLAAKLAPFERDALLDGARKGSRAVALRFSPSPELAAAGTTITTVRARLATVAEIVKVVPLALPSAPAGLSFVLLALTSEPDEVLAKTVGLELDSLETLAEPVPASPEPPPALLEPQTLDLMEGLELDESEDVPGASRRGSVRVEVERLDDALEALSALIVGRASLVRAVGRLAEQGTDVRELQRILREQQRQVRDLRATILRVRMVPVSDVLGRVPLIVRALRRSTGKSVRLEVDAGRSELDKAVAERIFPAVVHLVRNAVDHALEPAAERVRAGKPAEGLVRIECRARGTGQLEMRVSDDGRGIDVEQVARRAGRTLPLSDGALLQLLCRPGFTTREAADATSGRGMGMDIVRKTVVEQLGGELALETETGKGTTFTLRVPLTVSIVDALSFECGSQRFVVPLSSVEEIVELDPASTQQAQVDLIWRRGESLPLVRLDDVLGFARQGAGRGSRALVVRREGEALAFCIDRMLGQQEVVVRPLEDPLLVVPGVAGATDLGDGRATLVLDLFALGALLHQTMQEARP
jgi:two-component system chemotaxis sensor kinase CheA